MLNKHSCDHDKRMRLAPKTKKNPCVRIKDYGYSEMRIILLLKLLIKGKPYILLRNLCKFLHRIYLFHPLF